MGNSPKNESDLETEPKSV